MCAPPRPLPNEKAPGSSPGAVPAVVGVSLTLPGSGSIHTLGDWNSVLFRRVRPGMAFPFRRFVSGRVLVEAAVHPGSDRYFLRKTAGVPRQGASSQPISVPAASAARVAPGSATLASVLRMALSWQSACSAVLALPMAAACSWASAMAASTCVVEGVAEGGLWPRPRSNRVSPALCPAAPAIAAAAAVAATFMTGMTAISIGNPILGCCRLLSGESWSPEGGRGPVSVHCTGGPAPWGLAWPGFQHAHRAASSRPYLWGPSVCPGWEVPG